MVDRQRALVYDAEHLVHRIFDRSAEFPMVELAGSRLTIPVERRFASLDSVKEYVDQVMRSPAVLSRWNRAATPVSVRERSGRGSAHYQRSGAVIAVPGTTHGSQWALRELVVLHELAHHLADDATEPNHGPSYVSRLLTLTGVVIGPEAELLLRITFAENGVRTR